MPASTLLFCPVCQGLADGTTFPLERSAGNGGSVTYPFCRCDRSRSKVENAHTLIAVHQAEITRLETWLASQGKE